MKVTAFEKKHFDHVNKKCKGKLVAFPQLMEWDKDCFEIKKVVFCIKCLRWEHKNPNES